MPVSSGSRAPGPWPGEVGTCWSSRRRWRQVTSAPAPKATHASSDSAIPSAHYVEMALLARARWHDLEAATGRQLLHVTGQVTLGDETTQHAIASAMTAAGAPVEEVSATAAAQRFPGIDLSGPVLVEPESGVLGRRRLPSCAPPGRRLRAAHRDPRDVIATKRATPSPSRRPTARPSSPPSWSSVPARARSGSWAWTPRPAPPPRSPRSPTSPPGATSSRRSSLSGATTWSTACPCPAVAPTPAPTRCPGIRRAPPYGAFDPTDPAALEGDDPAQLAQLVRAVARVLPALDPQPVATERCVYDNSADADFVLDRVGSVVVGCGTSGHAFKFGPLLGELLADLAEHRHPAVDLTRFSLRRHAFGSDGPLAAPR